MGQDTIKRQTIRLWTVWAIVTGGLWCSGCATYIDHISKAHAAAERGDFDAGVDELNGVLGVNSYEKIPNKWSALRPLAALERAMLLQALGEFEWSARDISAAETELEFLDLKMDTAGNIGKYIFNDSAEVYKTQPTERLALNAMNMLNYLAMGNVEGAAVESRRFTVTREYLASIDTQNHGAFGSYLAGFVFEQLGETDRALRYYEEALDAGDLQALREPVVRLSQSGSYEGRKLKKYLNELDDSKSSVRKVPTSGGQANGEILVVIGLGRVPYKIAKRIPIGKAVGIGSLYITGNPNVLAYSALKVVTYPELVERPKRVTSATVMVGGRSIPVELITDLGKEITREYEEIKPKIIGAALTRMIARAAAAEGARAAARQKGGAVALLAALGTEAALLGLDKPDTRSWTFLPNKVYVCRTSVPPGQHELRINLQASPSENRILLVDVAPGGFNVIAIRVPR
ncbi:MAG: hypothetical protein O7C75_07095 [Verrucomicrobia bacterium]|nr:hypothetical protein [Verrucomicrobiota bacterium]